MRLDPFAEEVEVVSPVKIETIIMTVKKDASAQTPGLISQLPGYAKNKNVDGTTTIRGVVVYGPPLSKVHEAIKGLLRRGSEAV